MQGRITLNAYIHAALTGDMRTVKRYLNENAGKKIELDHQGHIALMREVKNNGHEEVAMEIGMVENMRELERENELFFLRFNAETKAKLDVKNTIAVGDARVMKFPD